MIRPLLPGLLISLALAAPASGQQWRQYQPDGGSYRIDFPGQPAEDVREVVTDVGPVRLRTSSITIGDKIFMTITSHYPRHVAMGDPQKNLDGARDSTIRKVDGTLRAEKRLDVGDKPARHLLIDLPRGNLADALLVLDDHQLLQAIYVGPQRAEEPPEARRFLGSFTLLR
ncbi:hypothetical protein [Enhydrobacter sp.]|uniref:hypothetical protein n=1 Tax=Enhydrobacter sp. TaxID=1894999 RepID=UPI00261B10ED|nr:hypothetical protein [Enhydrobacter sp.]WIM09802.1 MAG: hypothetical protein OJF58_000755 [Enhydrobacter sp.]